MALGPGKYDDLATYVREQAEAEGVLVAVINGKHGGGFSVQAPAALTLRLPIMLRQMANDIDESYGLPRK